MPIPTTHNKHRYSKACDGVKELPGAFRSLCWSLAQPKLLITLKSSGSEEKPLRRKEEGISPGLVSLIGSAPAQCLCAEFCSFSAVPVEGKGESECLHITHCKVQAAWMLANWSALCWGSRGHSELSGQRSLRGGGRFTDGLSAPWRC